MHCVVPIEIRPSGGPNYVLHSFGSQSPYLLAEIAWPSWSVTQVCCKSVLKFVLVFNWQIGCHESFHVSRYRMCSSASHQYRYNGFQESRVEDTVQSTLGDAVGQVFMNLHTHEDIKLFIDKDINIWLQQHQSKQHHEKQLKATYQMQQMQEEGCWQHIGGAKLQSQADPLMVKETLQTQAMRWWCDMKITRRQRT